MTSDDLKTVVEIFIACVFAEIFVIGVTELYKKFRNRRLDINCDNCQEPEKLSRTPDRHNFLCKTCMEAYLTEHDGEFSPEAVAKARKGFRKIKRKRR